MRVIIRMSDLLGGVELCVREERVPDQFRAVVQGGWTVENGAQLLTALYSNYSGAEQSDFGDVIHYEATVNGRGKCGFCSRRVSSWIRSVRVKACVA